jgi:hypothetical protein
MLEAVINVNGKSKKLLQIVFLIGLLMFFAKPGGKHTKSKDDCTGCESFGQSLPRKIFRK